MGFSYNASLAGLNANSNALSVAGNNIANSNTIGFRSSSVTFADVFSNATGARLNGAGNSLQIGTGVKTSAIHTNYEQGNLNESTDPLHVAVQGTGFFVVKGNDGLTGYTRAGDFTVDKEGYLVDSSGGEVQGFMATNGQIVDGTPLSSIKLPLGQILSPQTTTQTTLRMNLDSRTATGSVFNATAQVYDSLGNQHIMNLSFTRLANGSFDVTANLDGNDAELSVNGGAAQNTPANFTFDASGNLTAPTAFSVIPDAAELGGATLPSININLRETNPDGTPGAFNIKSFALTSAVSTTIQDGYSAGELSGASVDQNGNIVGTFNNGEIRVIAQYGLATFASPEGLSRMGNNMFGQSLSSGQATVGTANNGGRGSIAGGSLEQSNVNITNEFVRLIEAQRGFQANSRVINTLNQTFQDVLQIV